MKTRILRLIGVLLIGLTSQISAQMHDHASQYLARVSSNREKRQAYIAAPVFGRPEAAAAAKLFVVAAGAGAHLAHGRPLFEAIGQKTFVIGEEAHMANVIKIAGNFTITTVIESLAESFALVRKFGIEPNPFPPGPLRETSKCSHDTFLEVLTGSLFPAPVYQTYGRLIASDNFEHVGFKLPLGFKDNRLVLPAAEQVAAPMPMASLIHDRFVAALAQGLSEADWSAIARVSYRNAGL